MRILLAEDNLALSQALASLLRGAGYAVDVVHNGAEAKILALSERFDLVILDLNLPEMDGLEVLRGLRGPGGQARAGDTAVLILTARATPEERIRGLDLGADDYLVKPFDIGELEARVRSLLRRQAGLRAALVTHGGLTLDLTSRQFLAAGQMLDLPARERDLLELLFTRAGKVVAREAIVQSLTALDDSLSPNAIEQYASRLRRRISPFGLTIRTARGIGYYLDRKDPAEAPA